MWGNYEPTYSEWCLQEQEARAPHVCSCNRIMELRPLNQKEIDKWWQIGHIRYHELQKEGHSPSLSKVLADELIDILNLNKDDGNVL